MTEKHVEKPIFILGLPRSGTSMIAGALKKSGAWAGTTVAATAQNPKGFFEHTIIREQVVKRILKQAGCDPLGVKKLPPLEGQPSTPELRRTLLNIIRQDGYKGDRPWLYKDAKLSLLWPMFKQAFPNAHWIYVQRDLDSFVRSCLRTSFMKQHSTDPKFWELFAHEYIDRIHALKQEDVTFSEISTPEIVSNSFESLKVLIENLGLDYNEKKLKKFIAPEHWHGQRG